MSRRISVSSLRAASRPRGGTVDVQTHAADIGERPPSYMYKLNESKRSKLLLNEFGHRQRLWAYNSKRDGARFAAANGVSIPEVFVESASIDTVAWDELPIRFVVKPVHGAANRGVLLLERTGASTFVDLLDGRTKTVDQIVAQYREHVDSGLISMQLTMEELLRPRMSLRDRIDAPDDFKIYTFYDSAAVVMQRRMYGSANRADWRFKFWSVDWDALGAVKYADRCDDSLERPDGSTELIAAAEQLGRELAVPFVRLDFYDTDRGVVFGEVSPHPGLPEVWSPELDQLLGAAWERAEVRLLVEGRTPNEPSSVGTRTITTVESDAGTA